MAEKTRLRATRLEEKLVSPFRHPLFWVTATWFVLSALTDVRFATSMCCFILLISIFDKLENMKPND